MLCSRCGAVVPDDFDYCPDCGGGVTHDNTGKEAVSDEKCFSPD